MKKHVGRHRYLIVIHSIEDEQSIRNRNANFKQPLSEDELLKVFKYKAHYGKEYVADFIEKYTPEKECLKSY